MGIDQRVVVAIEEVLDDEFLLGAIEGCRILKCHGQIGIECRPRHVILNLQDQRRNQIHRLVQLRIFLQQQHQVQVVFGSVQAHPRKPILPSHAALVERLMLMPDDRDVEGMRHRKKGEG